MRPPVRRGGPWRREAIADLGITLRAVHAAMARLVALGVLLAPIIVTAIGVVVVLLMAPR